MGKAAHGYFIPSFFLFFGFWLTDLRVQVSFFFLWCCIAKCLSFPCVALLWCFLAISISIQLLFSLFVLRRATPPLFLLSRCLSLRSSPSPPPPLSSFPSRLCKCHTLSFPPFSLLLLPSSLSVHLPLHPSLPPPTHNYTTFKYCTVISARFV